MFKIQSSKLRKLQIHKWIIHALFVLKRPWTPELKFRKIKKILRIQSPRKNLIEYANSEKPHAKTHFHVLKEIQKHPQFPAKPKITPKHFPLKLLNANSWTTYPSRPHVPTITPKHATKISIPIPHDSEKKRHENLKNSLEAHPRAKPLSPKKCVQTPLALPLTFGDVTPTEKKKPPNRDSWVKALPRDFRARIYRDSEGKKKSLPNDFWEPSKTKTGFKSRSMRRTYRLGQWEHALPGKQLAPLAKISNFKKSARKHFRTGKLATFPGKAPRAGGKRVREVTPMRSATRGSVEWGETASAGKAFVGVAPSVRGCARRASLFARQVRLEGRPGPATARGGDIFPCFHAGGVGQSLFVEWESVLAAKWKWEIGVNASWDSNCFSLPLKILRNIIPIYFTHRMIFSNFTFRKIQLSVKFQRRPSKPPFSGRPCACTFEHRISANPRDFPGRVRAISSRRSLPTRDAEEEGKKGERQGQRPPSPPPPLGPTSCSGPARSQRTLRGPRVFLKMENGKWRGGAARGGGGGESSSSESPPRPKNALECVPTKNKIKAVVRENRPRETWPFVRQRLPRGVGAHFPHFPGTLRNYRLGNTRLNAVSLGKRDVRGFRGLRGKWAL